jgi:hypothetical protein
VYAEAFAVPGHGFQRAYDTARGRAAGTAQAGRDQRVEVVDDDDEAGEDGVLGVGGGNR